MNERILSKDLVAIIYLEKFITLINTKLYDNCNGPKNLPVLYNIVPKGLFEYLPNLKPTIQRLVSAAHHTHYCTLFCCVHSTAWALFPRWSFTNVSVISYDSFKGVEVMDKCLSKFFYVGILTRWIRSLKPHQIPLTDVNPKLVSKSTFSCKLVQGKRVALLSKTFLGDATVGAIDANNAIVDIVARFPVLENNLEQIG